MALRIQFSFLLCSKLKPSYSNTTELKASQTIVCLYEKKSCIQIWNFLRNTPHDLKRELSYCEGCTDWLFQTHHVFRSFHRPSAGLSFLETDSTCEPLQMVMNFPPPFRRSLQSWKKSVRRYRMYFLTYDWPWLHYFGNEIDYCSVDHCWLLNTEQQWNPSYR
jgi:hypothetical protein